MSAEANGNPVSDLTMPNRNPIFVLTKIVKGECRDKRKPCFRFDYAEPQPIFVLTKIAKGESRGKRKSRFRFDYAEPQPIFVLTKIVKGESRGKWKSSFRFDYTELQSYLRMYKDNESRKQKTRSSLVFLPNKISSSGRISHFSERKALIYFLFS